MPVIVRATRGREGKPPGSRAARGLAGNAAGNEVRRRCRSSRICEPSFRVSLLLITAPNTAPVNSGAIENVERRTRADSRRRTCPASGAPATSSSPPGTISTPRRCAHDATYARPRSVAVPGTPMP